MITVISASKAPRLTTFAAQPTPTAAIASETGALPPSLPYGRMPTSTTAIAM